jgi:hypothetical protein
LKKKKKMLDEKNKKKGRPPKVGVNGEMSKYMQKKIEEQKKIKEQEVEKINNIFF